MCTAGRVIEKMSTDGWICGVTSVDDKLFALLERADNQVAVYSISDYRLLRHIQLPGFKPSVFSDMTSCVRHKCLYASDYNENYIYRYDWNSGVPVKKKFARKHISKWSVPGSPRGLSVTPGSCNLLVACGEPKLVELSADSGQCVREITLQSVIEGLQHTKGVLYSSYYRVVPDHTVQLTTGQYVVSQGLRGLNRVCMVDDEGRVTHRSYGDECGFDVGRLHNPSHLAMSHLAVDEDSQFIFVADQVNNRVVLLSPTLHFLREFSEGVSHPSRLYFHQTTRRLFVGKRDGDVSVIQL